MFIVFAKAVCKVFTADELLTGVNSVAIEMLSCWNDKSIKFMRLGKAHLFLDRTLLYTSSILIYVLLEEVMLLCPGTETAVFLFDRCMTHVGVL